MDFACFKCFHENEQSKEYCEKCSTKLKFDEADEDLPESINGYDVLRPLGRGFYGMTFVVKNNLDTESVIKIVPTQLYTKDKFENECKRHAQIQKESTHIVKIINKGQALVKCARFENDCYIAELEYLDGITLKKFIEQQDENIRAYTIGQIAIDLLKLLEELKNKQIYHNDLHPDNIMVVKLQSDTRRADESDPYIKAVAIDLGSSDGQNKSGDKAYRMSDVHWVAKYIQEMSRQIITNPDKMDDTDYRIALALDDYARHLMPETTSARFSYNEMIEAIRDNILSQTTSWSQKPLRLKNFDEFYNAQHLDFWNIPDLFVDEDKWLNKVAAPGPSVIVGMRGCGKTMLLKALQVHARMRQASPDGKDGHKILTSLKNDGYIGLYVSSSKLLDNPGIGNDIHEPLLRLFVAYGLEAIKTVKTIKMLSVKAVKSNYYIAIAKVYSDHFNNIQIERIISDSVLERELRRIQVSLEKNESSYKTPNAVNLFVDLAKSIKSSFIDMYDINILYLLDDVSTRYLSETEISKLLSQLLFPSEYCAFKFTSEAQSINALLRSPGMIEKVKDGRDVDFFDFGHEVYEKTKGTKGKKFVLSILEKRRLFNSTHPNISPKELLGDCSLASIAKKIFELKDAKSKEGIYHGLSALSGVCVGDIGDILKLYSNILSKRCGNELPITPERQNLAFLEISNLRLHDLNKREKDLKNYAISFAEAAHDLLISSSTPSRIREYNSIYINNESNIEEYYSKIREMIDAGIFVYSGGSETPRLISGSGNPINQFVLAYRKILGLSKLIGITQGDRFELSGKSLDEWLNKPDEGATILKKTVEKIFGGNIEPTKNMNANISRKTVNRPKAQRRKVNKIESLFDNSIAEYQGGKREYLAPGIEYLDFGDFEEVDILIASIGFEERAFESIKRCIEQIKPSKIILIQYKNQRLDGYAKKIFDTIIKSKIQYEIIGEEHIDRLRLDFNSKILVDISGMSKELVFIISKDILTHCTRINFCYTEAEQYAPLDKDIEPFLNTIESSDDKLEIFDKINGQVPMGEELSSIEFKNLFSSSSDESRKRVLITSCDAKYEKLFYFIKKRDFDTIAVAISNGSEAKDKLAYFASEIIKMDYDEVTTNKVEVNDLDSIIKFFIDKYYTFYLEQTANVELALSGNKLFAVAAGYICANFKISNCWYIKPKSWDEERFSSGVGLTKLFAIDTQLGN